jgi:hypothetical protein
MSTREAGVLPTGCWKVKGNDIDELKDAFPCWCPLESDMADPMCCE